MQWLQLRIYSYLNPRDWFHHVKKKKNLSKLVLHDCKQMPLGVYFDVAVTAAAERKGGGNANE